MDNYQAIYDAAIRQLDISFVMTQAQSAIRGVELDMRRPSVLYRPSLSIDGDKWCALYGENLQDGVAGFGDTPELAMLDFDQAWQQKGVR